jgi:hypothetical protein
MRNLDAWLRGLGGCVLLALLAGALSGCALTDFGAYRSFDDWFVCRHDTFAIEEYGVELPKYGHPDYVVNDLVIRPPIFIVYEAARFPLIVVAAPYYALGGGSSGGDSAAASSPPR